MHGQVRFHNKPPRLSPPQTRQPVFVQLLQGVFRVYHCNWLAPGQKAAVEGCIRVLSDVGKTVREAPAARLLMAPCRARPGARPLFLNRRPRPGRSSQSQKPSLPERHGLGEGASPLGGAALGPSRALRLPRAWEVPHRKALVST